MGFLCKWHIKRVLLSNQYHFNAHKLVSQHQLEVSDIPIHNQISCSQQYCPEYKLESGGA